MLPSPFSLRRRAAGFVALTALAVLGACGSDSDPAHTVGETEATNTVAPNGESVTVQVLDNSFRPETIEISAGTEVVFDNRGRNDHNVLPADESQGWGVQAEGFKPGDTYAHVFSSPGEYRYFCSIHGTADAGMVGIVIVSA